MKKLIITLFLFFNGLIAFSQSWEKTFIHDTGQGSGFDIIETNDNGYVMVGDLDLPTGAIRHYIWAVKTDQDGNELWSRVYDYFNISYHEGRAVTETLEGDLLIVGNGNLNKASILKINADGDSLWTKYYGGNGHNSFKDIIRKENGDFIVVGQFEAEMNSGQFEVWAQGINANGDVLWERYYFSSSFSPSTSAFDISFISSEKYLISGAIDGQGFTMEIDGATGIENWDNQYLLSGDDILFAGAKNSTGDQFLIGGLQTGFAGVLPSLFQIGASGEFLNTVAFSSVSFGAITDVSSTADLGYILTGSSYDFWDFTGLNTGFITKLDANLEVEWEITYPDSLDTQGAAIKQTSDGSYILAGRKQGGLFLKKIAADPNSIVNHTANNLPLKVFPNPVSNILSIALPETVSTENLSIQFYDASGKAINRINIKERIQEINIRNFPKGVCNFLLLKNEEIMYSGKILIHADN